MTASAKQSRAKKPWIASSLSLLAMTAAPFLELPCPRLYDIHHAILAGSRHDRPYRPFDLSSCTSGDFLDNGGNRRTCGVGGDGNARHQHPFALAAADGRVAKGVKRGRHFGDNGISRGLRARPTRGRADRGSLWPPLALSLTNGCSAKPTVRRGYRSIPPRSPATMSS